MNMLGKFAETSALLIILLLSSVGAAQATPVTGDWYPYNIDTLATFMRGASYKDVSGVALTGSYDVTALAYQSYLTDQFRDSSNNVLFTNDQVSGYGTKTADLTSASFRTTGLYGSCKPSDLDFITPLTDKTRVHIYELKADWTKMGLSAGTLIIGINDDGIKNPCTDDFDDFILAASRSAAPTPVPGAVWLLGSGLLGLMGFKKTRKTA